MKTGSHFFVQILIPQRMHFITRFSQIQKLIFYKKQKQKQYNKNLIYYIHVILIKIIKSRDNCPQMQSSCSNWVSSIDSFFSRIKCKPKRLWHYQITLQNFSCCLERLSQATPCQSHICCINQHQPESPFPRWSCIITDPVWFP